MSRVAYGSVCGLSGAQLGAVWRAVALRARGFRSCRLAEVPRMRRYRLRAKALLADLLRDGARPEDIARALRGGDVPF